MKRTEEVAPGESIARRPDESWTLSYRGRGRSLAVAFLFFARPAFAAKPPPARDGWRDPAKSIAVLPFENLSRDQDNDYFATGVQDEILTRLAKMRDLKVISRTSTQQYQSRPGNLREIAQTIGRRAYPRGQCAARCRCVRVNVQLIKARKGCASLGGNIRRQVDRHLLRSKRRWRRRSPIRSKHISPGAPGQQITTVPPRNSQAYDAYLRGLALIIREGDRAC